MTTETQKPIENQRGGSVGFYEIKPLRPQHVEKENPGFIDTFRAEVRGDNSIYNNVLKADNELRTLFEYTNKDADKNFKVTRELLEQADPDDWPALITSRTSEEFYRRLTRRQIEREARITAHDGTLAGNIVGGLFNGVTDPASWIPIANGMRLPKLTSAYVSGFARAIPGSFAAAAVSEANLSWSKETHTFQEAAFNTVVQTLFGGIVGGGIGSYRTLNASAYRKLIGEAVDGKEVKFSLDAKGEIEGFNIYNDAAGSESVNRIMFEDNQIYGFTNDGKLSVAKPLFWMTGKWFKNPVVQGLISPSVTVKKFTNDMLEHNFDIVKSVVKGKYKPQALQTALRQYETMTAKADLAVANSYFDYLGLPQGQTSRNIIKSFLKDKSYMKFDEYTLELNLAISAGGVHRNPKIASAAQNIYETFYKPLEEQLVALNVLAPNVKPFGAVQYLNRIIDRDYVTANKPLVSQFLKGKFAETNNKISKALEQVNNLQEDIKLLKSDLEIAEGEVRAQLQANLGVMEKKLASERKRVRNKLRQGKYSPDMLVGKAGMSFADVKALKALRKPINAVKREVKRLEQELSVHKRKVKNQPADETQLALEAQIKERKAELEVLREKIGADAEAGRIPEHFVFRAKNGNYYLRRPDRGTLKFRDILDDSKLDDAVESTIENMLGLNDFQITQGIVDGMINGSSGDPLKPRTLLISDEELYRNKILVSDTRRNIKAYIQRMGRFVEMKKYLKNNGYSGDKSPVQWITDGIKRDYKILENNIVAKGKGDTAQQMALTKLDKQMREDINLASVIYNRITGGFDYNPRQAQLIKASRFLNNWAYATQLGALLFVSLQESVAPMFRLGLSHIKNGVLPYLANLTTGNWKANRMLREQAADLALGIEYDRALLDISFQLGNDFELPLGFIERQAGNAAQAMGIANFSTIWADKCTRIATTASVSKNLREISRFLDGSISKGSRQQLAVIGLNSEVIAKRIQAMDKEFGESLNGARLANFEEWTDREAATIFKNAIMQEVRSTNFSGKNIANYPTWVDNPNGLSSSLLIYMGWMFNATANYTLPLLQRFDVNKIMGAAAMISAGMLVDPLRKISKGQDIDQEPFDIFKKGFLNSGVGGMIVDVFNKANAIGDIIPELQVDRYQGKGWQLAAGMPGTLIDTTLSFAGMAAQGEWNKSDLRKLKRVIPLLEAFYLRKATNDWIDSLNIPETRKEARRKKK